MVEQIKTPVGLTRLAPKAKSGNTPKVEGDAPPKAKKKATPKKKTTATPNKKSTTPRRSRAKKARREDKLTSVVMGIIIPLMVLSCSASVSRLWHPAPMVAVCFALVGLSIMAVSIGHLTDSLMVATKSPRNAAFLMALGVDALVALPEVTSVLGLGDWVTYTTMFTMTLISMRLNVVAFLNHE